MTNPAITSSNRRGHRRPAALKQFYFGAVYYPEHWDRGLWENDAARMSAAGFNIVRMGEFAWHLMEPQAGVFDFSFFDEAISLLARHDIQVIMCTPTATPPRWLTFVHPDILRIDADGRAMLHGSRQHCCHSNLRFRDFSRKITTALAAHFKDNPNIVGWQTDNEIHCHFSECHCPSCQTAFRHFIEKKYGTIANLNQAWGTSFWALHFDNFEQIETPHANRPTFCNPSQQLDYYRYISHAAAMFQRDQVEILRAVGRDWFITHNGTMSNIDYRGDFGTDLDVLGVDIYPLFDYDSAARRSAHAFSTDNVRSMTGNYIIPEHQSGPGGQSPYMHDTPAPGELRKLSYVSLAHGGDSLLYFRWRTCRFGAEEYWCGIIDHDNIPRRRYREICETGEELKRLGPMLQGTTVSVDCAVSSPDYDSETAHKIYPLGLPSPGQIARNVHRWLYEGGFEVGCIHPEDDLSDVKLYVIPHWEIIRPEWVTRLEEYVCAGGVLVIGARCGTRIGDNQITAATFPGVLSELAGATVEEYGKQNPDGGREHYLRTAQMRILSEHWYETLKLNDADAYAVWEDRFTTGQPAISIRSLGCGKVLYVGTYLSERVCRGLMPELATLAGLTRPWPQLPPEIEAIRRVGDSYELLFLINHHDDEITVDQMPGGTIVVGSDNSVFAAYDVKVLYRKST